MRDAVQQLRNELAARRKEYSMAIRKLELISEEIHRRRRISSQVDGARGRLKDEVSALEVQASLVGLNITEDSRASDEHIHYRPDDVDGRTSESSSIQQDSESLGSADVGSFECNGGEEEDRLTVEQHQQSPLVKSTCSPEEVPHLSEGQLLEVPSEVASEDTVAVNSAVTVTDTLKADAMTDSSKVDTMTETAKVDDVPGTSKADSMTEASKDDTVTEASKVDAVTEVSRNDTMKDASQDDIATDVSNKDDTVTEVPKADPAKHGEHC